MASNEIKARKLISYSVRIGLPIQHLYKALRMQIALSDDECRLISADCPYSFEEIRSTFCRPDEVEEVVINYNYRPFSAPGVKFTEEQVRKIKSLADK
jgi:hypothetical protein